MRSIKHLSFIEYEETSFKVEYTLTDLGQTLIPLIQSIAEWRDSVVENYSE